jgi:hypothetical protein
MPWLAPLFVHELRHQQDVWADRDAPNLEGEVSAQADEAAFIAERCDQDAAWLDRSPAPLRFRNYRLVTLWQHENSAGEFIASLGSFIVGSTQTAGGISSLESPADAVPRLEALRRDAADDLRAASDDPTIERLAESVFAGVDAATAFWKDPVRVQAARDKYRRRFDSIGLQWRQYQRRWALRWIELAEQGIQSLAYEDSSGRADSLERIDLEIRQARDRAGRAGWDAEGLIAPLEKKLAPERRPPRTSNQ